MSNKVVISEENKPAHKKYVLKKRGAVKTDYKVSYETDLNPAQLSAVVSKKGPILVIAGAGSGKTKTLTYRVARLIEDGVSPDNILLLTANIFPFRMDHTSHQTYIQQLYCSVHH